MTDVAIRIEELGKSYRISSSQGAFRYRTLRDDVTALLRRPFERTARPPRQEEFWALRGVSLDIRRGEVLGVLGRNGAGKSTLLKLLSRITEPSEGRADIHGRVGSLLEVGTGFHPELTGRENVFLSGAILGMTKAEIRQKFDRIVEFAEVEKFLDTPVKRYSSGMYVRLAFSVAAHLEPEILLVDEVLAVGDFAFQEKCLTRIREAAVGGQTILLISHNLGSITRFCERAILLEKGRLVACGTADEIAERYVTSSLKEQPTWERSVEQGSYDGMGFTAATLLNDRNVACATFRGDEEVRIRVRYRVDRPQNATIHLWLTDAAGTIIFFTSDTDSVGVQGTVREVGLWETEVRVPSHLLAAGHYSVSVSAHWPQLASYDDCRDVLGFTLLLQGTMREFDSVRKGIVEPLLRWDTTPV